MAITRELAAPPVTPPALEPALFQPNALEKEFLNSAISADEQELMERLLEVQKEWGIPHLDVRVMNS